MGIKPGEVLSAATQAAQGLAGAQALVAQAQSGIVGALGAGIPGAAGAIGSVSKALGAAGGALNGSVSGIAAGLTAAVGPAVTNFASGNISSVLSAGTSLTTAAGSLTQSATSAINNINKTLSTPVTDPINIADFAKETPALTAIGSMDQGITTGVLAQAKKLVGQAADVVTSEKGLGAFGLGAEQLERAGVLKPGMSKFVVSGASTLANLLKSPAAFTGKDGIKSAADLLQNPAKQAEIQQNLMSQGVNELKSLGVPTNLLSAQGLAGTALNAAKSIPGAEAFLKGLPIPGDAAGALVKAFETNVRDGAFAANLAAAKIPPAFKAEVVPVPAANTVNRETVNAASARVIGNDKVPEPNYGPPIPDPGAAASAESEIKRLSTEIAAVLERTGKEFVALNANISYLEGQQTITDAQWEAVNAERIAIGKRYNPVAPPLNAVFVEVFNSAPEDIRRLYLAVGQRIAQGFRDITTVAVESKNRINELAKKRQGPPDTA